MKLGVGRPFLTIGSYPVANAYAVTKARAKRTGAVQIPIGTGAVAFYSSSQPTNVYIAYSGSNVQIEIYDPSAAEAQKLVASHALTAVR